MTRFVGPDAGDTRAPLDPVTPAAQPRGFAADRPNGPTTQKGHALASTLRRRLPGHDVDWDGWVRDIEAEARALGAADAERRIREAVPRSDEFAAELAEMLPVASQGPFLWGEVTDPAAFVADAARLTEEHGDAQLSAWVVQTFGEDGVTVAYCGNGPRAHHNAALIAHLLNNADAIRRRAAIESAEENREP